MKRGFPRVVGVHPFVITLGMMAALRGLTVVLPQENNLNRRKAAAKKCMTEIAASFNPGDCVLAYLRQVAHTGALALESAEPQEPEEKRARTD